MEIIATRKKGLVYIYIISLILSLFITLAGIISMKENLFNIFLVICGLIMLIFSVYMIIDILKTPKIAIKYNSDNYTLIVYQNTINLKDITFVEYRRARAKHIQYKWGTVIITTPYSKVICKYIKNCEYVAKKIYSLSLKAKEFDS